MEEVERLWQIVQRIRAGVTPTTTVRPDFKDTLNIQLMLEAADSEEGFRSRISSNAPLLRWSQSKTDEQLAYLVWMQRSLLAA